MVDYTLACCKSYSVNQTDYSIYSAQRMYPNRSQQSSTVAVFIPFERSCFCFLFRLGPSAVVLEDLLIKFHNGSLFWLGSAWFVLFLGLNMFYFLKRNRLQAKLVVSG